MCIDGFGRDKEIPREAIATLAHIRNVPSNPLSRSTCSDPLLRGACVPIVTWTCWSW